MDLPSLKTQCDALVIGGGTAALVAALEARKSLDRVVVACKRKAGQSGNTIVSGAAFSACVPGGAHFRSDHPSRNDSQWLGNSFVEKAGQNLKVTFLERT